MAKAYGEVLRGIRNGSCSTYCATGAELIHLRFTDDWNILRCRECGGQSRLGILVHAPRRPPRTPPSAASPAQLQQARILTLNAAFSTKLPPCRSSAIEHPPQRLSATCIYTSQADNTASP